MEGEKRNRIVAAVVINAIILIAIIIALIIYQLVTISSLNSRKDDLLTQLNTLKTEVGTLEDFLDKYNNDEHYKLVVDKVVDQLVEYGYDKDDLLNKDLIP